MTATTTTVLVPIQPAFSDTERFALAGYLAGYRGLTREAYALLPSATLPGHWHPYRIETRSAPARRVFVQGLVADLSQSPPITRAPARSELMGSGAGRELDATAVPNQGLRLERR